MDKTRNIYCPKCVGCLELKKVNNIDIDVCYICQGIWFDEDELDRILKFEFKITNFFKGMFDFDKIKNLDNRESELNQKVGNCPVCGKQMQQKKYKGILIDYCINKHGVWLDGGELQYLIKKSLRRRYGVFWVLVFLLLIIITRGCMLRSITRRSGFSGGMSGGAGGSSDW